MLTSRAGLSLQEPIDRFARALSVPRRLLALHPRKQGNSGDYAALAPAITLGVVSAFEGFVEEFVAVSALHKGLGLAQIAKAVGRLNNPDLQAFQDLAVNQLGVPGSRFGNGFTLRRFDPPAPGGASWWGGRDISWGEAKTEAEAWMQVRHCLTHGLTSGWRGENWPGPLGNQQPATSVLRETDSGKHTLVIHGAISCARIYIEGARHIAEVTAAHLGLQVDLGVVPDFPLNKEVKDSDLAAAIVLDTVEDVLDSELVQEGSDATQIGAGLAGPEQGADV